MQMNKLADDVLAPACRRSARGTRAAHWPSLKHRLGRRKGLGIGYGQVTVGMRVGLAMRKAVSRQIWMPLTLLTLITGCASFQQTPSEVFVRPPGERVLQGPIPVAVEAADDWEFAWLSDAAYERTPPAEEKGDSGKPVAVARPNTSPSGTQAAIVCPMPDVALAQAGWKRWQGFPDAALSQKIKDSNLRVEVWEKKAPTPASIAVAFGGTNFTSGKDWRSNLRWFLPVGVDEYTEIVSDFGPAFVEEYLRRAADPAHAHLKDARIYSTGHSLGGGLAQQFAYALPTENPVPRVTKVYAFDPSPVTGFYSVDVPTRDHNKKGLLIDRIYERGEILAIVRSFMSFIYPPTAVDPAIRAIRYSLFYPDTPIAGHSIAELACKLQAAAGHGP
jgi:hypothetical protein